MNDMSGENFAGIYSDTKIAKCVGCKTVICKPFWLKTISSDNIKIIYCECIFGNSGIMTAFQHQSCLNSESLFTKIKMNLQLSQALLILIDLLGILNDENTNICFQLLNFLLLIYLFRQNIFKSMPAFLSESDQKRSEF